jgi:hypothetical protein
VSVLVSPSIDAHRRAEVLMGRAERAARTGYASEAARLFYEAAECEARAFSYIPAERAKTRGLVAVSAVSLYLKAGIPATAVRLAQGYLDTGGLPDFAAAQLAELLASTATPLPSNGATGTLSDRADGVPKNESTS